MNGRQTSIATHRQPQALSLLHLKVDLLSNQNFEANSPPH